MSINDLGKLSHLFGENEWCQKCRDWYVGECEDCKIKPNYQGIALNNARVIESFDKVLQKRNDEIAFLIDVIEKTTPVIYLGWKLNDDEYERFDKLRNRVERKGEAKG